MPPGKPWHFTESPTGGVYVTVGKFVLYKYGTVKQLEKSSDSEDNVIKMVFSEVDVRPKSMKLSSFNWSANDVSRKFQGSRTLSNFIAKYYELFGDAREPGDTAVERATSESQPPKKRVKTSKSTQSHKALMPVTRSTAIRDDEEDQHNEDDGFQEQSMDKLIDEHFKGYFLLKVNSLKEPPKELLIRERNDVMVAALKVEMMENPCNEVAPLLCIVDLPDNEIFNKSLKDSYSYVTIGGNHSRQALQELLKEHVKLQNSKSYTHKLCAVYEPMDLSLAKRLASKHNRASSFTHEMTSWDWVVQCRKLLYELSNHSEQEEPPSAKPDGWKKACAAVLALTVNQLDERMIFFLASVPNKTFLLLKDIFRMYSKGELKDQVVSKTKKGICSFAELKGSAFKPFRGLEANVVHDILEEVSSKKNSFKEATTKCNDVKSLQKVQAAFIKATNCKSWEEAMEKYPTFTTSAKLEPFKTLDFSNLKKIPEKFFAYCQHIKQVMDGVQQDAVCEDQDKYFFFSHESSLGLIWKTRMLDICPENTEDTLKLANISRCPGFHLTVLDLVDDYEVSQTIKKYSQIIRAINYSRGLQDFAIVGICCLKDLFNVSSSLEAHCDGVQVAVCGINPTSKGSSSTSVYNLEEITIGIVIAKIGNPSPLSRKHSNCFVANADSFVMDNATKEKIFPGQKPLSLFEELIEIFSKPSDWILNGPTGIGTCMIASLRLLRNCVSVENSGLRFIHSKIRCVKELSSSIVESTEEASTVEVEDSGTRN